MKTLSSRDYKEVMGIEKIKVLITDLDETLRQGILDEKKEGESLLLNQEYYEYLKDLHDKGIQIFVASKNENESVLKEFAVQGIDPNIFTKIIANREPKYLNIKNLLHQLEGVKSEQVIFIDDNRLERDEVKKAIPDIHVIDYSYRKMLHKIPYLNGRKKQQASRIEERKNSYRTGLAEKIAFGDSEDKKFLESLDRRISLSQINPKDTDAFKRVINLLFTTHQINFNPGKFGDEENALAYLKEKVHEGYEVYAMGAEESGMLLGIGGAYVVNNQGKYAIIEDATTSCSILGRGFENKALIELIQLLKFKGVQIIDVRVKLTSTNKRVQSLLQELGFLIKEKQKEITVYTINTDTFVPPNTYDYINISEREISQERSIIPSVMLFFDKYVKPLCKENSVIANIGSARGEVLGFLRPEKKKLFEDLIREKQIRYIKVDIDPPLEEPDTIKANAEDLSHELLSGSIDMVIAVELLEHTENPRKIINEIIRICKIDGYIFVSIPCFLYPKHEYPIDLRRIGPQTLISFFPKPEFEIIKIEEEGSLGSKPLRTILLIQKKSRFDAIFTQPMGGRRDIESGITYYE